jgi:hypothetical protein
MIDVARQGGAVVPYWDTDGGIVCGRAEYVAPLGIDVRAVPISSVQILAKKTYRIAYMDGTTKTVVAGVGQRQKDVYFDAGRCVIERNQSLAEGLTAIDPFIKRREEVTHGYGRS